MTRLVAFGCSYTRGTALDDVWNFEKNCSIFPQPSKYAWPQLIADELNVECINLGKGGYSNKAIWHTIINFDLKPSDIVFVHWSFLDRYHYYENKETGHIIDHTHKDKRDKMFFKYLHSDYEMINDLFLRMNHVNSLHRNLNHILMAPVDKPQWNNTSCTKIYLDHIKQKYPRANDNSHPGMLAHKEFARQLLQSLKY
jgi:hypothetical protein